MKVLFISVHPDDETLGCGGTILKHKKNGDEIYWLIITDVIENEIFNKSFVEEREQQIELVSKSYSFTDVYRLSFPTMNLQNIDIGLIIKNISNLINKIKPEIIYTINRSDIHTDHQIASKAIISATKSFRFPFIKKLLMYECISETEIAPPLIENIFIPNVFCDITDFIDDKLKIMQIYKSEVQIPPMPRSIENIEALARYRGSSIGVQYAEAFMLLRELI